MRVAIKQLVLRKYLIFFSVFICLLLSFNVLAQTKVIMGIVKDSQDKPIKDVIVELPSLGKSKTDEQGSFTIEYAASSAAPRQINARKEGYEMVDYAMSSSGLNIVMRQLTTTLAGQIFTQKNAPLGSAQISWKGVNDNTPIKADAVGNFYITFPADKKITSSTKFIVNGKTIDGRYFSYDNTKNKIKIVLSGDLSNPLLTQKKETNEKAITTTPATADTVNTEVEKLNLERLVNDLELQKQLLTEQGIKIRTEMERIAEELNSNQNSLTPQQRNRLRQELDALAKKLIDNEMAFESAQAETKKLMDRIRGLLFEKDSITSMFTERIEEVEAEKERARLQMILAGVAAFFCLIIAVGAYFVSRKINKQNADLAQANQDLIQTKDELEDRIEQIEKLNKEVTTQNQKITDSIRYAQTIQEAVLPQSIEFEKVFSDHFILYEPKDMVSGDFYWLANHYTNNERTTVLAVIDCTGHGVPGAFMSMIGYTLLNEIVNQDKVFDTAQILTRLHEGVKKSLQQNELSNNDGMDVAICTIHFNSDGTAHAQFTGAKRPLYYYQNSLLQTFKGDSKSIGGRERKDKAFTTQDLYLMKDDVIYLMTDGFSDQQNDRDHRKFGSSNLLKLLEMNATLPLSLQKQELMDKFRSHKGDAEQRDDITIIGVRI